VIAAVDTSLLLNVLIPNPAFAEGSAVALDWAAAVGSLVICDAACAELCIHFPTQRECDDFLKSASIRVQWLSSASVFVASRAWRTCRSQGGKRTRILADFLIGAYAETQTNRLISRDRGFFRSLFPTLELPDPTLLQ
jgi:predicted nucleic acid-binding protein